MQVVRIPFTNFQFGEISPSLIGRTDTQVYTNSAQKLTNFLLRAEGGVIKRPGTKFLHNFGTTVESSSFTITVSDYANIATGTKLQFYKHDGTLITVEFEASSGSAPSSSSGNTHYVRAYTNNNTTADNLFTAINAIDGFTVSNPSAAVVTVVRDSLDSTSYISVSSTDTTRLAVTDLSGGTQQQVRLIPFIFSDDERYIVALSSGKIEIFILDFDASGNASAGAVTNLSSATITSDTEGTSISSAITEARLKQITYAQSGDVLFLCHNAFMPYRLVRTGLLTFELSPFSFDMKGDAKQIYQPYYSFQQTGYTITPSATSGSGVTVKVKPSGTDEGNWAATTAYSIGDFVEHSNQIYKVIAARDNSSSTVPASDTTHFQKIDYFDDGSTNGGGYGNSLHTGITLRYRKQEIELTGVTSGSHATGTIADSLFIKLSINALRTINGSGTIEVTMPLHGLSVSDSLVFSEADAVNGISASNINGTRAVVAIIDENTFTITAGSSDTATSSGDGGGAPKIVTSAATADWDEQSFSSIRGYPAAICFHEGRLWFGGTLSQPDGIWGSQSAEFFNFNTGTALDNQSIVLSSSVGQLDQIKHLVSNRDLQVFTVTSEFIVPAFENTPVTPSNAMVRRQTPYGIADVKPYVFDGATIYVQRSGTVAREFIFSDEEAAYVANAISSISSHLIKTPVQMTTLQAAISRPESYVFMVNSDGTMAVFNSNRAEKRAGWTQFTTKGFKEVSSNTVETQAQFHSVCTVDERAFVAVKYDKGDATKKIVLLEIKDELNMDHSLSYTNGSSGVFTVSSQFENGAVVDVVSGTDYLGQFTVASGQVNVSAVDSSLTSAEIGYSFPVELKTNPLDIQSANGPTTGMLRGLGRVILDLNSTLSISVNGKQLQTRNVTDDFSIARTAFTGKKEFRMLGYSRDPQLTITQSAPLSVQVNSIIAEVQI